MSDRIAYIALGSNLGDSRAVLAAAFQKLDELSQVPVRRSSLWRSLPVDCPPGSPDFLNAVAAMLPLAEETPESLLAKLQQLERDFGRKPKRFANEPRPLDLDLIAFGEEIRSTPVLVLPHPRAFQRRFVLAPLAELASEMHLPGQQLTVLELLDCSPDMGCERLL